MKQSGLDALRLTVLALLIYLPASVHAYKEKTHEKISERAALFSVLAEPDKLNDIGLYYPIRSDQQKYPRSDGQARLTVLDLILHGANFEDTDPRALNHFYNPIDGLPLSVLGLTLANNTSPAWALEDAGEITGNIAGAQQFSYKDARGYFYKAFTEPAKDDRDRNWGLTFQSLGQVIHHVQDMAQPQHVRNDAHLDKGSVGIFEFQLNPLFNPSAYELYTNDNRETLPFSSGSAPDPLADLTVFRTPRAFWTDGQGRGLAQYTNANFLSAGTNFGSGKFASPAFDPALRTSADIQQLCASANPPCTNPNLSGTITFYGNMVSDSLMATTTLNPRASSHSIFDADLTRRGGQPVFSLNRFNFAAAHEFLIPRAVAYSAGLLNYFFRGKLEISLPEEGVYGIVDHNHEAGNSKTTGGFGEIRLKLRNVTAAPGGGVEPMSGAGKLRAVARFHRNACYEPDLSGEYGSPGKDWNACRANVEEIVVSDEVTAPAGINDAAQPLRFVFQTRVPISATDLHLQVVYRGPLGQEGDAVAVATQDISEPTYIYNYSRWDQNTYAGYPSVEGGPYTWAQWCTQGYASQQVCNSSMGLTKKGQYSPTASPIPGYDPAGNPAVPPGQWADLSLEPPFAPTAILPAPVGTLARCALLTDAQPSNSGLMVQEWVDTALTSQSSSFMWTTGTVLATTNQRDPQTGTLTPSTTYLPGRGVYLPAAEHPLLTSGTASNIPPLMLVQSQCGF